MAWDIVALFGDPAVGSAKVAMGAVKAIKRQVNFYLKNIEWGRIDSEDPEDKDCLLILRIEFSRFQESLNDSISEFADAVFTRLALYMVQRGFVPLNDE
ncbi:MAG: hypothetical protein K2H64_09810 [Desulfovibrio sp.]|nr:hypothetical protein [Desulfovibrio sp.]